MLESIKVATTFWNESATAEKTQLMLRWWEHPYLHDLIDKVWHERTGCHHSGEYIEKITGRRHFSTAISIGCGSAEDEIHLLQTGLVGRFILYDISEEQLARAKQEAESRGVDTSRLILRAEFLDLGQKFPEEIDLVYWRHSLHHMLDVDQAIIWCKENLSANGAVYCNDACPPSYMQWGDNVLDWCELFRRSLPVGCLKSPFQEGAYLPERPTPPSVEFWKSVDPTECVDSGNIIPSILRRAPDADIRYLGGIIYAIALDDIINNFRREEDNALLRNAMLLDHFLSESGMNYFFTSVIKKSDFI